MFSRIVECYLHRKKKKEKKKETGERINTILQVIAGCADRCLSFLKNKRRNGEEDTEKMCLLVVKEMKKYLEKRKDEWGLFPWQEMTEREKMTVKRKLQEIILKAPEMKELQEETAKIIEYIEEASIPPGKEGKK